MNTLFYTSSGHYLRFFSLLIFLLVITRFIRVIHSALWMEHPDKPGDELDTPDKPGYDDKKERFPPISSPVQLVWLIGHCLWTFPIPRQKILSKRREKSEDCDRSKYKHTARPASH